MEACTFTVDLYECQTWSLTLRGEPTWRAFQNRFLKRIFGPQRDKVMKGYRKLYSEKLHNSYSSPNIIRMSNPRRIRLASHVTRMREKRNTYKIPDRKPEEDRPLRRPTCRRILEKLGRWLCKGLIWLSTETSGGTLLIRI
jgi:hypothetical protein